MLKYIALSVVIAVATTACAIAYAKYRYRKSDTYIGEKDNDDWWSDCEAGM